MAQAERDVQAPEKDVDYPPYVVLEYLNIGGFRTMRIVGITDDEGQAHDLAMAMADAGCRVWFVNPGDVDGARIERYVGRPGAAWLYDHGLDPTQAGAGDHLTGAGE